MAEQIKIGSRTIGAEHPTYIVAELSANHHQDFSQAVRVIEEAKRAGADAVKLQTYTADTITVRSDKEFFRVGGGTLWDGRNLHDLYAEAYTPWEWQPRLMRAANDLGLDLFSTPFDPTAVDFLEEMKVPAHKVASFEIVDIPLIQKIAKTGKPIIMSTGMASVEEIEEAVQAARGLRRYTDRVVEMYECLSGGRRRDESAHNSGAVAALRSSSRALGSYDGCCRGSRRCRVGSVHHREAFDALPIRPRPG